MLTAYRNFVSIKHNCTELKLPCKQDQFILTPLFLAKFHSKDFDFATLFQWHFNNH